MVGEGEAETRGLRRRQQQQLFWADGSLHHWWQRKKKERRRRLYSFSRKSPVGLFSRDEMEEDERGVDRMSGRELDLNPSDMLDYNC